MEVVTKFMGNSVLIDDIPIEMDSEKILNYLDKEQRFLESYLTEKLWNGDEKHRFAVIGGGSVGGLAQIIATKPTAYSGVFVGDSDEVEVEEIMESRRIQNPQLSVNLAIMAALAQAAVSDSLRKEAPRGNRRNRDNWKQKCESRRLTKIKNRRRNKIARQTKRRMNS